MATHKFMGLTAVVGETLEYRSRVTLTALAVSHAGTAAAISTRVRVQGGPEFRIGLDELRTY